MHRHPIESNFYASVSDADINVIFAPTRSLYAFSRVMAEGESISPDPLVRHVARKGGIGDYEPAEVKAMAYRIALATIKRLRVRCIVLQLWPSESRQITYAKIG
jgi:hypothetical protein